ncbi:hypothetical protein AAY473_028515 [Plecturocebus cupreus]
MIQCDTVAALPGAVRERCAERGLTVSPRLECSGMNVSHCNLPGSSDPPASATRGIGTIGIDRISLCCPSCSLTPASSDATLHGLPKCWNYRHEPPCPTWGLILKAQVILHPQLLSSCDYRHAPPCLQLIFKFFVETGFTVWPRRVSNGWAQVTLLPWPPKCWDYSLSPDSCLRMPFAALVVAVSGAHPEETALAKSAFTEHLLWPEIRVDAAGEKLQELSL